MAFRPTCAACVAAAAALLPLAAAAQPRPPAAAQEERAEEQISPVDAMNKARRYFDYGDYPAVSRILNRVDVSSIESRELRIDAYRLLGLSLFYQGKRGEAYRAFLELLYLDPDFQMDPFYVPPAAAEAFNEVRRDAQAQLAPIRAQKRAEAETKQRALEEEAVRRRQREQEEEQRRLTAMAPVVERRVVQREFWVTMLPFGVGQLQNGDRGLGIALATGQVVAGATSAGSALLIEGLRDSGTGKFGEGNYPLAQRLNVAKWIGAGLFYALWIGGAVHAAIHFQPESTPVDRLITNAPAAAQPPAPLPEPQLPNGAVLQRPPAAQAPGAVPPAAQGTAPVPPAGAAPKKPAPGEAPPTPAPQAPPQPQPQPR